MSFCQYWPQVVDRTGEGCVNARTPQQNEPVTGAPGPLDVPETQADESNVTDRTIVLAERYVDEAVRAHCLRVAAWAGELATALGISEAERKLIEQSALFHHVPQLWMNRR